MFMNKNILITKRCCDIAFYAHAKSMVTLKLAQMKPIKVQFSRPIWLSKSLHLWLCLPSYSNHSQLCSIPYRPSCSCISIHVENHAAGTVCKNHSCANSIINHYLDIIMSARASQITVISIVCSTVCSGANQRKHQTSTSSAFVEGIHRCPVKSPHVGPVTLKKRFHMMMSSF